MNHRFVHAKNLRDPYRKKAGDPMCTEELVWN